MKHLSDEELLLDYYEEALPEQRAAMRAHLESCAECRALDRELRGVLALVITEPLPEAPPGFEGEMWARLEPHIASSPTAFARALRRLRRISPKLQRRRQPRGGEGVGRTWWSFELPRWALAAAAVVLAAGSFALGRVWDPPPAPSVAAVDDTPTMSERMLRSEVEEHLERSQRVLVELVNADDSAPVMLASDRERAADLVAAGRLYRRPVEEIGDAETRDLLEDVERVLVELANGPEVETSNDLSEVRARISNQDLIFRLRVTTAEMRARQRRARTTW
jgi:hypothetical protein